MKIFEAALARAKGEDPAPGALRDRIVARFPSPADAASRIVIDSSSYRNGQHFLERFHIEAKPKPQEQCEFHGASLPANAEDPFRLSMRVDNAGAYIRLCCSFKLNRVAPGDILHLQWVMRAIQGGGDDVEVKLMTSPETMKFKVPTPGITGDTAPEHEWTHYEAFVRYLGSAHQWGHLVFSLESACEVELAGVMMAVSHRVRLTPDEAAVQGDPFEPLIAVHSRPATAEDFNLQERTADRPLGVLDYLGADGALGRVWLKPDTPTCAVRLFVDGERAAGVECSPKPGGEATAIQFALPEASLDGHRHQFEVRFEDERVLLGGRRSAILQRQTEGVLVGFSQEGVVAGWAVNKGEQEPVRVTILVDGSPAGEVVADRPHPNLQGVAYRNGRCAFSFALPDSVRDGARHVVTAQAEGGRFTLGGGPLAFRLRPRRLRTQIEISADAVRALLLGSEPPEHVIVTADAGEETVIGVKAESFERASLLARIPPGARRLTLKAEGAAEPMAVVEFEASATPGAVATDPSLAPHYAAAAKEIAADPERHLDAEWYLAANPSARVAIAAGEASGPSDHWLRIGAARGASPQPWFDETWYRQTYPDVSEAIAAGLTTSGYQHWIAVGAEEGRRPSAAIDPAYLAAALDGDVLTSGRAAVEEWVERGLPAGRPATAIAARARQAGMARETAAEAKRRRTDLYGALATAGSRRSMFDAWIERLIADLPHAEDARADQFRRDMARSETLISEWLLTNTRTREPLVSIVMPTYNRAFVLAEALQSAREQSYQNWELLVCDDGSTDKTAFVVRQFNDPRIRYIPLEKANGAVARNFGMQFARGELITFLDSDNIWHPHFLALSVGALENAPGSAMIYSGYVDTETRHATLHLTGLKFSPFDYPSLLTRNYIDLNTLMIRREIYDAFGGFDPDLPRVQDWDLVLRYAYLASPIAVPAYLAFYRRNVAWGQVTDLFSHMNYSNFVRERAYARLVEHEVRPAATGERRRAVSIVCGPSAGDARDAASLAVLLGEAADVRVIAPQGTVLPATGGAEVIHTDGSTGSLSGLLWGEAVIVCDGGETGLIDRLDPAAPAASLRRVGDVAALVFPGKGDHTAVAIGALQPFNPETMGPGPLPDGAWIVIASAEARATWIATLLADERVDSALLLTLGADERLDRVSGGEVTAVAMDEAAFVRALRTAAVLILPEGDLGDPGRLSAYAYSAMSGEVSVLAAGDPTFQPLIETACVNVITDYTLAELLTSAERIRTDGDRSGRTRKRGQTRYFYYGRPAVLTDRLGLALARVASASSEAG